MGVDDPPRAPADGLEGRAEDTPTGLKERAEDAPTGAYRARARTRARSTPDANHHIPTLVPLADGERPRPLVAAVGAAVALAVAVAVGAFTIHHLSRYGGSPAAGLFIAAVLLALAWGMYQRRYWAVLSFQALLAFQILVTSLALVVAETWLAAGLCALGILLAGWLFWKLVRVMGRIQVTERAARGTDEALR